MMMRNSTLSSSCHSSYIDMAVPVLVDFLGLFGKHWGPIHFSQVEGVVLASFVAVEAKLRG